MINKQFNLKQLLREELEKNDDVNPKDLTIDYFKRRIPFLKDYEIITSPDINPHPRFEDAIKMRKESYNTNVKSKIGDDIYMFPHFNIVSEFNYSSNRIRNNIFYTFRIENKFYMTQPENMDELLYRTFIIAGKMKEEKELSKTHELIVPVGEKISKLKLNETINDINGRLFKIEEFTDKMGIPLFN